MKDKEMEMLEMLELAWGIIANAHGGNWDDATPDWMQAAKMWRDRYHAMLAENAARRRTR